MTTSDWLFDIRFGLRSLGKHRAFTLMAVAMLALGVGASTAIFSAWNGLLRASLPGVSHPEELVVLTDPAEEGMWTGRTDGVRSYLSYDEFVELRDHARSFTAMTATQAQLETWRVRADNGTSEQITGRLVSGEFFQALGVHPALGRLFAQRDDREGASAAVISYSYWRNRFGGRTQVIGTNIEVGDTAVPIIGVAPDGFSGETVGERPDIWLPLHMQPHVLPDSDWLHDTPPEKTMWLRVFARLKPHVSEVQAAAEVNTIFQAGLRSFYGAGASGPRGREFLNQQIEIHPASRGASPVRQEFSTSLTVLLAAAAILLLIGCANLANLMLARGIARHSELAVRAALGAVRGRLVWQLVSESLVLACIGGAAALPVALGLHRVLLTLIQRSRDNFFLRFSIDVQVLVFVLLTTVLAVVVFGAVPAWQVTKNDASAGLIPQSRGTVGAPGRLRSDRLLVLLQLALSLPLLIGAGLLARSVYNLRHADLGFTPDHLVLARVNLQDAYGPERRDHVLDQLITGIRQLPGVRAVSFSQLGVFGGGESLREVDVEGYTPARADDRTSAVDTVGPGYFSALQIPIVRGRDFRGRDPRDDANVTVVNEAFARRFFGNDNALGKHVTIVTDAARTSYEIVGVAKNAHTRQIRADVQPRYFVQARQPSSPADSPTLLVRTAVSDASMIAAVRKTITSVAPAAPVLFAKTSEAAIAPLLAQDYTTAQVAIIFGAVALALTVIGLYSVIAYGTIRRTSEIAIRIALGAESNRVVVMILRENLCLVVSGLAIGAGLAYAGTRLLEARLYRVGVDDPATAACAILMLLSAAAAAAYLPARRASTVDPMVALRRQ